MTAFPWNNTYAHRCIDRLIDVLAIFLADSGQLVIRPLDIDDNCTATLSMLKRFEEVADYSA